MTNHRERIDAIKAKSQQILDELKAMGVGLYDDRGEMSTEALVLTAQLDGLQDMLQKVFDDARDAA